METRYIPSAAVATPAPCPPLSDDDAALLELFLTAKMTLMDVARRTGVPFVDLLNRLQSAPIQAALAAYHALTEVAASIAGARARAAALTALENVVATAPDNPVERRRAATAIVRATTPPPSARPARATGGDRDGNDTPGDPPAPSPRADARTAPPPGPPPGPLP